MQNVNISQVNNELFGFSPRKIFSIYDMLYEFNLIEIHQALEEITRSKHVLNKMADKSELAYLSPKERLVIRIKLQMARKNLVTLNFGRIPSLMDEIDEIMDMDGMEPTKQEVYEAISNLESIIKHEMHCAKYYQLPRDDVKYLLPEIIDDDLRKAFSDCIFDLEEANRCFVFGINTACVYHCICVLEKVFPLIVNEINSLGIEYALEEKFPDSWGTVLNKLESELKKLSNEPKVTRNPKQFDEISGLITYMRAVKFAWRDDTMHARKQFTEGVAKSILEQTVNLLKYLNEILNKESKDVNK